MPIRICVTTPSCGHDRHGSWPSPRVASSPATASASPGRICARSYPWVLGLVVLAGCTDAPTRVKDDVLPLPSASVGGYQSLGSFTLPTPETNDLPDQGSLINVRTGINIPANQIVRVTVGGAITATFNPAVIEGWGSAYATPEWLARGGTIGPFGNHLGELRVSASVIVPGDRTYGIGFGAAGPSATVLETLVMFTGAGELEVSRTKIDGWITCSSSSPTGCPPLKKDRQYALEPYWLLAGNHAIQAEALDAALTLTANYRTVSSGTTVTFTAGSTPASVPYVQRGLYGSWNFPVPLQVQAWRWQPDSGAAQTVTCTHANRTCSTAIRESGTMYVDAIVNSRAQTKEVQIEVFTGTPQLVLEADKSAVEAGETVTFTARARPDTINGQAVSITDVQWSWASGPMLSLAGPPSGTRQARNTATASMNSTLRNSDCGPGVNPCLSEIYISDVLTVMAKLNGQQANSARADVAVADTCATDDPILNDATFQAGLRELWTGMRMSEKDVLKRREQGGWIVPTSDGGYRIVPFDLTQVLYTSCDIHRGIFPLTWPPGTIGMVHGHPMYWSERNPACGGREEVLPNGESIWHVPPYMMVPSDEDAATFIELGQHIPGFKSYVLDPAKLMEIQPDTGSQQGWKTKYHDRCGY